MNRKIIIPILFFFLISTLACNLLSPGAIEQAVKDAGEGVAQTAVAKGQSTVQSAAGTAVADLKTPEAVPTEAGAQPQRPAIESLSSVEAGIDQLESYRMDYTLNITGKDSQGLDRAGTLTMQQSKITASGDNSFRMNIEGNAFGSSPGGVTEIYQVAGVMYMISSDDAALCTSIASESGGFGDTMGMMTTTDFVSELQNMSLVERDVTVNGILTDHYTFDASSNPLDSWKGEVWVAQEGGFAVRMTGTRTGKLGLADEVDGTMQINYELKDINQVNEIVIPENCSAPLGASGDLPIPENATEKSSMDQFLSFKTPDAPKVVADFYLEKLGELGWQVETNNAMETLYILGFTKEDQRLDITISGDASGTSVVIVQGP